MPICDGVEAARRIRALEVERGYDARLPSKHIICRILLTSHSHPLFSSHRLECGLPRINEAAVLERGNGCFPLETCKQDSAFRLTPETRTSTFGGYGYPCRNADFPLIERPAISRDRSKGHDITFISSILFVSLSLSSRSMYHCILYSSSSQP